MEVSILGHYLPGSVNAVALFMEQDLLFSKASATAVLN